LTLLGAAGVSALDLASLSSVDGPANGAILGRTMFAIALLVGLAIVAPLVGAFTLFTLLKRHSQLIGPLIHIEQAATPSIVLGPYTASAPTRMDAELESLAAAVERKRRLDELATPSAETSTAEPFDLGPSFEDVMNAQRSQSNRQESAVLAQLFAANLSLHEKIELDREGENSHEAATEINA
jgi:hypothetical protein